MGHEARAVFGGPACRGALHAGNYKKCSGAGTPIVGNKKSTVDFFTSHQKPDGSGCP